MSHALLSLRLSVPAAKRLAWSLVLSAAAAAAIVPTVFADPPSLPLAPVTPPSIPITTATDHSLPLAQPEPLAAPAGQQITALSLGQCLDLAMQRQPRIAAARASLAAAEEGKRSLDNLHAIAAMVTPELPVRRKQAALGVASAAAGLDQAERETVYAVTRTFFSVMYAREQEKVARGVVDRLTATHGAAKSQLDKGGEVTAVEVDRTMIYIRLAKTKLIQSEQGSKRGLAALREAIGLGSDCTLEVPAGKLPAPDARPNKEEVISAALTRRAELARSALLAEVICLEVEAQGTGVHKKFETFAIGSDIHSIQVPQGVHNTEYRPGALPPEMPAILAGCRPDRVNHAKWLYARAQAGTDVARNLIALEAEEAYLRWEEASRQVVEAQAAAELGDRMAGDLSKDYAAGAKVKVEEVVNARVLASQARASYNEYLYQQILALTDLERITAGAFCARLTEARPQQPAVKEGSK